jgi:tetratricopeptide (TPR) repeat protein
MRLFRPRVARMRESQNVGGLVMALGDREENVRTEAVEALVALGELAIAKLADCMARGRDDRGCLAAAVLARIGGPQALAELAGAHVAAGGRLANAIEQELSRLGADRVLYPPQTISRERRDLLWQDPATFEGAASGGSLMDILAQGGATFVTIGGGGEVRSSAGPAPKDTAWVRKVNERAVSARSAAEAGDYEAAISRYRAALELAPGCDLYLMSVGVCYAKLGHPEAGLPYLVRADRTSPGNEQIGANLDGVRELLQGLST